MKEYESFKRIGTTAHRSYYVPFSDTDKFEFKHGIVDRNSSSRFFSLDGEWQIKQLRNIEAVDVNEELTEKIQYLLAYKCMAMIKFNILTTASLFL